MKVSLHVWRDSSNKYVRLIEPLEGVFSRKFQSLVPPHETILTVSCHQVTDPEMKLKVIKDHEVGEESLMAVAYSVSHCTTAVIKEGVWQTIGAICVNEGHVFHEVPCSLQEAPCSLQEAMVLLIGTSYTINLQFTLKCDKLISLC